MTSKNLFLLLASATFISFTSCKKDYNCSCFAPGAGEDDPTVFRLEKVGERKAKKRCKAYETYPGRVCELK